MVVLFLGWCALTLLLRGPAQIPAADLAHAVALREASGEPRKAAIAAVAASLGIARRVVYDAVVSSKQQPKTGDAAITSDS